MPKLPRNIVRRGKAYYFRARINGELIRRSLGTDLAEARRKARQLMAVYHREHTDTTVVAFQERWLREYVGQRRNPKGQQIAAARMKKYILPIVGYKALTEVTQVDVRQVRAHIEQHGARPLTVKHVLGDLRCMLRYAVDVGALGQSPFTRTVLPRIPETLPRGLTEAQVNAILVALTPRYDVAVELALYTGLRWGELYRLRWEHVQELPEPALLLEQTKSARVRRVPLFEEAQKSLEKARERGGELVLPRTPREPRAFPRALKADFAWTFHQLRHTFATRWLERGGSIEMLRLMLGHSTVAVTERYGRISDAALFAEVNRLGTTASGHKVVTEVVTPVQSTL